MTKEEEFVLSSGAVSLEVSAVPSLYFRITSGPLSALVALLLPTSPHSSFAE